MQQIRFMSIQKKLLFIPLLSLLLSLKTFGATEIINYAQVSGVLQFPGFNVLSLQFYATPFQNNLDQSEFEVTEKVPFKTIIPILESQIVNLFIGSDIIRFHIAPGDSLFLTLTQVNGKPVCKFSGKGAAEAAWFQQQKQKFESTIESPSFSTKLLEEMGYRNPDQFKKYLDSIVVEKNNYLRKNSKGLNPAFVNWQMAETRYEYETFKLNYPTWFYSMRGIENRSLTVDSSYYNFLADIDLNQTAILNSTQYRNFLKYYFMYEIRKSGRQFTAPDLYRFAAMFFKGKTLQIFRLHLWADITQYGNPADAQSLYPIVKQELSKEIGFDIIEAKYQEKMPFAPGADAFPFTLRSIDGKKVSLAEFKGKVVYIDFWASWCGPCKREIPAGEELKKYFAGKEVVFLNVSIDEDESKWQNAVQNLSISGIHLLANSQNNPEVLQAYKVASIPSYFLIGKDGKFISAPAARPSSGQIFPLIEDALKK